MLKNSPVRVGLEMDSAPATPASLPAGSTITALEEKPNAKDIDRVRFEHATVSGWISKVSSKGTVMLEAIGEAPVAAAAASPGAHRAELEAMKPFELKKVLRSLGKPATVSKKDKLVELILEAEAGGEPPAAAATAAKEEAAPKKEETKMTAPPVAAAVKAAEPAAAPAKAAGGGTTAREAELMGMKVCCSSFSFSSCCRCCCC